MSEQPTFKIQFNPTWDDMILTVHRQLTFGLKAQKYLLENQYLNSFEKQCQKVLENRRDEPVKIIARFKYINRSNERKLETIEFTTRFNGENIKQEYLNKVTQPILQKISEIETEKDVIVLNMCFVKFFFENLQPLVPQRATQTVQINDSVYEMDEDCGLTFIRAEEEEMPGYRHM